MDLIQETVFRVIGNVIGSELTVDLDSSLSELRVNYKKINQIIYIL